MVTVLLFLIQTFLGSTIGASDHQQLGKYGGNPREVSISGFSSGADFAIQYHVAFSSELKGVGSIAGVVYYCGENSFLRSTTCKSEPDSINVTRLVEFTRNFSEAGLIDNISHIKGAKVFIFQGIEDSIVYPGNGQKIEEFYTNFDADIQKEFGHVASHCIPTDKFGNACTDFLSPYINQCNYNGVFMILNHVYGNLSRPKKNRPSAGQIFKFDQGEFTDGHASAINMDQVAYAYVPKYCKKNKGCKVHVALHGCKQSRQFIGDVFAQNAGYNEVAELNNIIILYPQTAMSLELPENPNGCYDWWGFTGSNYATKSGPQMLAIRRMINHALAN